MNSPILIVDDESSVRRFVKHSLEASGFTVIEAVNGEEALRIAKDRNPTLIILDYGLPDLSGVEVIRRLRQWATMPVIFLSARGAPEDKVAALDAGADDYLTKPFSVPELLARIRVALRHKQAADPADPIFRSGILEVDLADQSAKLGGEKVKLSATEFSLLALLVRNSGKIVSHRNILREVWGPNSTEHHHYLRVYFGMLRKKFEAVSPGAGALIENEAGIGYRLVPDPFGLNGASKIKE